METKARREKAKELWEYFKDYVGYSQIDGINLETMFCGGKKSKGC